MTSRFWGWLHCLTLAALLLGLSQPAKGQTSLQKEEFQSGTNTRLTGLIDTVLFSRTGKAYLLFPTGSLQEPQSYILSVKVIKGVSGDYSTLKAGWEFANEKVIALQKRESLIYLNERQTAYLDETEAGRPSHALANLSESPIARLPVERLLDGFDAVDISRLMKDGVLVPTDILPAGWALTGSNILEVRNYPNNTNIRVSYVLMRGRYNRETMLNKGVITAGRDGNAEVEIQYSFIRVPENNFIPRAPDERVGYYYTDPRTTLTRGSPNLPVSDILRWNLVKQDPSQELSKPVKPIVFYLDDSIPERYRGPIRKGVLSWNSAFERIGYREAIEVYDRPADASWDAGDIDYNVIGWNFSPGFSASFASFVHNPLTGEILGADVTITDETFERALQISKLVEARPESDAALVAFSGLRGPYEPSPDEPQNFSNEQSDALGDAIVMPHTSVSRKALSQVLFALSAEDDEVQPEETERDLLEVLLTNTVTHEIGHTLGLLHNFRASSFVSSEEIVERGYADIPPGSVMDYDPMLFHLVEDRVKIATTSGLGAYDNWAIEFGYADRPGDPEALKAWQQSFFETEKLKAQGFYSPFPQRDGQSVPFDFGSDPLLIAKGQNEALNRAIEDFAAQIGEGNCSSSECAAALSLLINLKYRTLEGLLPIIGGVTTTPVSTGGDAFYWQNTSMSRDRQSEVLQFIGEIGLKGSVLTLVKDAGLDISLNVEEEPTSLERIEAAYQKALLRVLLSPGAFESLAFSESFGNEFTVEEFLLGLTENIIGGGIGSEFSADQAELKSQYILTLIRLSDSKAVAGGKTSLSPSARAAVRAELAHISRVISLQRTKSRSAANLKDFLLSEIAEATPEHMSWAERMVIFIVRAVSG